MSSEDDDIKDFFMAYSRALRMEYGHAMSVAGIDLDTVGTVQQHVAENMIDWLRNNS